LISIDRDSRRDRMSVSWSITLTANYVSA